MAYATVDQLAAALRMRASTPEITDQLQSCLDAAAEEIDHDLDRLDPLPAPAPAAVIQVNIDRAVEWYKAADAAYGIIGFDQTGVVRIPKDGFGRYAANLTPWKQRWGIG